MIGGVWQGEAESQNERYLEMLDFLKSKPINHKLPAHGVTDYTSMPVHPAFDWAGLRWCEIKAREPHRSSAGLQYLSDGTLRVHAKRRGDFEAPLYAINIHPGKDNLWVEDSQEPLPLGRGYDAFQMMDARTAAWRTATLAGIDLLR